MDSSFTFSSGFVLLGSYAVSSVSSVRDLSTCDTCLRTILVPSLFVPLIKEMYFVIRTSVRIWLCASSNSEDSGVENEQIEGVQVCARRPLVDSVSMSSGRLDEVSDKSQKRKQFQEGAIETNSVCLSMRSQVPDFWIFMPGPQSSPRSLRNLGREFAGVAGQDIQESSVIAMT